MNIQHRQRGHIQLFDQKEGHDSKKGGYTRGHIHTNTRTYIPSTHHSAIWQLHMKQAIVL